MKIKFNNMKIKFNNIIKNFKENYKDVLIWTFVRFLMIGAFYTSYAYLLSHYFGIPMPSKWGDPLNIYVVIYLFLLEGFKIGLNWLIKVIQKIISRKKP